MDDWVEIAESLKISTRSLLCTAEVLVASVTESLITLVRSLLSTAKVIEALVTESLAILVRFLLYTCVVCGRFIELQLDLVDDSLSRFSVVTTDTYLMELC